MDPEEPFYETEEQYMAEVEQILLAYRQRKLREHLVGPIVSFVMHIVILLLLTVFVVGKAQRAPLPEIEVTMEEVPIKELEPPKIEEIEQMEDELLDEAPAMDVDVPDVPIETTAEAALEDASEEAPQSDDNFDMDDMLDVLPTKTPLQLRGLYGGRTAKGRRSNRERFGGNARGEDAVLRALRWLKKVQAADGSWENEAFSGLALLCFLAHGETPQSEEFGVTVQKAMQWLSGKVPVQGASHGYANGIATYALAEAYGMTQIPFLRQSMEAGLRVIVEGQQPGGGYNYAYGQTERWDLSVSGWQYQALKAGYVAGANVEGIDAAISKSKEFLKNVAYADGKFGYSSPGSGGNMTGVGTVALQLLGDGGAKEVQAAAHTILYERLPGYSWENSGSALYGWYYDTQAMFNHG
ncbi:MAG: terpene cyclase/mutase family protein, partial [Lentisphaeria bacterium]|nr:terpene cyclase/mutase family protein [Lentisphaeria bacterium]